MTAVSPVTKTARHAHIGEILARHRVRSQEELADLLAVRGVRVTQATLSRDLEELGAVRLRGAGGALVYALPGDPGGPGSRPGGLAGGDGGDGGTVNPGQEGQDGGRKPLGASAGWFEGGPAGRPRGQAGDGGQSGAVGRAGRADDGPGRAPAVDHDVRHSGPGRHVGGVPGTLARLAVDLLVTAEASANLVVLRTPAGGAQLLASAIDHAGWASILGTVAGDDTVLVIARDPDGGDEVARSLIQLAERRS